MYIRTLRVAGIYSYPPEVGGTTDNVTASVTEGQTAPTSSGNVSSGTASEAMIKAATAASSADTPPAGDAGDTAKPGAASDSTANPDATGQPGAADKAAAAATRGEAPPARIEAAVKNARAETLTKYGLTESTNPADVRVGVDLLSDIRRDPKAWATQFVQELGGTISFEKPAAKEEVPEEFPAPSLISADGQKAYSDTDILKITDILQKRIMQQLQPDLAYVRSAKTTAEQREHQQRLASFTQEKLAEARKLPHFTKENEPKILAELQAIPTETRRSVGAIAALYMAYNAFLQKSVFPSIDTSAETRVRESFEKKARTSQGQAHPSDQGGDGKTPTLKGVDDLAKHMERLEAAATA